jgi:hypothetical protein
MATSISAYAPVTFHRHLTQRPRHMGMGITRLKRPIRPSYIHTSRPSRVFPRCSSSAMEPSTNPVSSADEAAGITRFYRWHMDAALYDLSPPKVTTSKYRRARSRYVGMMTERAIRCPSRSARRRSSRGRRCSISSRVSYRASRYALECAMRPIRSNG